MPAVQRDSAKQADDALLISLPLLDRVNEPTMAPSKCVECGIDIDISNLSFEQKLKDDKDFCRRC